MDIDDGDSDAEMGEAPVVEIGEDIGDLLTGVGWVKPARPEVEDVLMTPAKPLPQPTVQQAPQEYIYIVDALLEPFLTADMSGLPMRQKVLNRLHWMGVDTAELQLRSIPGLSQGNINLAVSFLNSYLLKNVDHINFSRFNHIALTHKDRILQYYSQEGRNAEATAEFKKVFPPEPKQLEPQQPKQLEKPKLKHTIYGYTDPDFQRQIDVASMYVLPPFQENDAEARGTGNILMWYNAIGINANFLINDPKFKQWQKMATEDEVMRKNRFKVNYDVSKHQQLYFTLREYTNWAIAQRKNLQIELKQFHQMYQQELNKAGVRTWVEQHIWSKYSAKDHKNFSEKALEDAKRKTTDIVKPVVSKGSSDNPYTFSFEGAAFTDQFKKQYLQFFGTDLSSQLYHVNKEYARERFYEMFATALPKTPEQMSKMDLRKLFKSGIIGSGYLPLYLKKHVQHVDKAAKKFYTQTLALNGTATIRKYSSESNRDAWNRIVKNPSNRPIITLENMIDQFQDDTKQVPQKQPLKIKTSPGSPAKVKKAVTFAASVNTPYTTRELNTKTIAPDLKRLDATIRQLENTTVEQIPIMDYLTKAYESLAEGKMSSATAKNVFEETLFIEIIGKRLSSAISPYTEGKGILPSEDVQQLYTLLLYTHLNTKYFQPTSFPEWKKNTAERKFVKLHFPDSLYPEVTERFGLSLPKTIQILEKRGQAKAAKPPANPPVKPKPPAKPVVAEPIVAQQQVKTKQILQKPASPKRPKPSPKLATPPSTPVKKHGPVERLRATLLKKQLEDTPRKTVTFKISKEAPFKSVGEAPYLFGDRREYAHGVAKKAYHNQSDVDDRIALFESRHAGYSTPEKDKNNVEMITELSALGRLPDHEAGFMNYFGQLSNQALDDITLAGFDGQKIVYAKGLQKLGLFPLKYGLTSSEEKKHVYGTKKHTHKIPRAFQQLKKGLRLHYHTENIPIWNSGAQMLKHIDLGKRYRESLHNYINDQKDRAPTFKSRAFLKQLDDLDDDMTAFEHVEGLAKADIKKPASWKLKETKPPESTFPATPTPIQDAKIYTPNVQRRDSLALSAAAMLAPIPHVKMEEEKFPSTPAVINLITPEPPMTSRTVSPYQAWWQRTPAVSEYLSTFKARSVASLAARRGLYHSYRLSPASVAGFSTAAHFRRPLDRGHIVYLKTILQPKGKEAELFTADQQIYGFKFHDWLHQNKEKYPIQMLKGSKQNFGTIKTNSNRKKREFVFSVTRKTSPLQWEALINHLQVSLPHISKLTVFIKRKTFDKLSGIKSTSDLQTFAERELKSRARVRFKLVW